ncbi:MAG: hypothetical protein CGW95_05310 [Phenylobacterium zucineum]|nr:MAG: hypothetical protein CGW95_05310 [Phenylobacterium zucineum]
MTRIAGYARSTSDHFEPEGDLDPTAQRRLRGHLEQIDYTAYASNREILASILGQAELSKMQHLAVAAAQARGIWVKAAITMTEAGGTITPHQATKLAELRSSFDELSAAYEALRRMIERGYVVYSPGV